MEFKTEMQKATWERIRPMMREIFGEMAMERGEYPQIGLWIDSALVTVSVQPWKGEESAVVHVLSWVVTGPEMNADLMKFLLNESYNMRFGAFTVDDVGDIAFEYSLVGPTCDKDELKAAVLAVGSTANDYDDKIVQRWGGQRARDR